jgi:hypothetical protein
MSTVITAGNATNGLSLSADNTGAFDFKTGTGAGTSGMTISSAQVVSIPGNLSFNSGYGSAAVAYGCRAWVNFIGASASIRASGNVSSITRTSAGVYNVAFTTAMPDANYSAVASQVTDGYAVRVDSYNVSQVRVVTFTGTTSTDSSTTSVAVFR